jgi:dynein heavy chain
MLKKSVAKMRKLTKGEMTELKSIKKPPKVVLTLMKCVCILMAIKTKKKDPDDDEWWNTITGPKVLGNFGIIEHLANYDPQKLNH